MTTDVRNVKWQRARACGTQGNCVEVADLGDRIIMRDSKDPDGPTLTFTPFEWECFLDGVAKGEFDRAVSQST